MARLFVTGINLNKNELQNARIQNLSSAPSSPVAGQIYFNTSTNVLYFYNGTDWTPTSGSTEVIQDVIGTSVLGGTALTATYDDGNGELTIDLDDTAVTPGSYGSSTSIPTFTVDAQGRLTAAGEESIATNLDFAGNTGGGSIDLLTETLTISGNNGQGIGVHGSDNTLTISAFDASSSQKGVASFNSPDFTVTSGNVEISHEHIQDIAGAMFTGNTESGITVTYQDSDGTVDFDVADQFPTHTTSDLTEGTNLYYTTTRVQNDVYDSLIAGTGLSKSFDEGEIRIDIDSTVATLSDTQTLTNKTLGSGIVLDSAIDANGKTIENLPDPIDPQDAANKRYVDTVAAEGLHVQEGVDAATTTTLAITSGGTVTYDNGTSGVGATLTTTGSFATIDGVSITTGGRVLIKNEANQIHNGIYLKLSDTELARDPLFDSDEEIEGGDFVFVVEGTLNGGTGWVQTNTVNVIGTDNVIWQQFSGAGTYTAGDGIALNGNEFTVDLDSDSLVKSGSGLKVNYQTGYGLDNDSGLFVKLGTGLVFDGSGNITNNTSAGYGVRKYAQLVGDGTETAFYVEHGFGTRSVTVQVFGTSSPYAQVEADIEHTDTSGVTVRFAVAPSSSEYEVVIVG